jgi:hypothetical protein
MLKNAHIWSMGAALMRALAFAIHHSPNPSPFLGDRYWTSIHAQNEVVLCLSQMWKAESQMTRHGRSDDEVQIGGRRESGRMMPVSA